jgi:hypothetical protein
MRNLRSRSLATFAVVVAVVVVLFVVLGQGSGSSDGPRTHSFAGAVTVQRRNLVATDTETGTLAYTHPQIVYNRLNGAITWLPSPGRMIVPGHPLFDVNNSHVLLMDGSFPAYRDLGPSDGPGPDILELNSNLVRLGYEPYIEIDDQWQADTTVGVERLQAAESWAASGTLTLGQVVFLPGPGHAGQRYRGKCAGRCYW